MTDKFPAVSSAVVKANPNSRGGNIVSSKAGEIVHIITHNDILFGRGSGPNDHRGNINFRQIVSTRRRDYLATSTRKEKVRISNEILNAVKNLNPPGRFLEKVESGEGSKDKTSNAKWITVSEHKAIKKIKQALRQMRHIPNLHRRVHSAPETILSQDLQTNGPLQIGEGYHIRSYSQGNVYGEASYQSRYYHYPANQFFYNNYALPTRDARYYSYSGTSVCHSHMPPPPPPTPMTRPIFTPSPISLPSYTASPIQSETYCNTDLKHCSVETNKVTSRYSNYQQNNSPEPPMTVLNLDSESSPVSSFKPEPARFIYPTRPSTNTNKHNKHSKQAQNYDSRHATKKCAPSTFICDSLSLFDSSSSSALISLTMESIDDDDNENLNLTTVIAIDEKSHPETKNNGKRSRSNRYFSTDLHELSSRNLGDGDDFWLGDNVVVETRPNKYKRCRDYEDHHNLHFEYSQHSLDELPVDDISVQQAGVAMMDIFKSDDSLFQHERDIFLDSKVDRSKIDKFDRMVMSVTAPLGFRKK